MASAGRDRIFLLTIAVLCMGSGVCQIVNHELGKNLPLKCDVTGKVDSITWKHINDKIVEWSEGEDPEWFKSQGFTGVLDTKNGNVELFNLSRGGKFTCEILSGSTVNSKSKEVVIWDKPSKPIVTCKNNGTHIILTCLVNTSAREKVEWSGPDVVKGTDESLVYPANLDKASVFFCSANNPVGVTGIEFKPEQCEGPPHDDKPDPTPIIVTFVVLGIAMIVAAIAYWKHKVWVPLVCNPKPQTPDVKLEENQKMNAQHDNSQDQA